MYRAAAITVSDKGYAGQREDKSGPLLQELLRSQGYEVVYHAIVPDDKGQIAALLRHLADNSGADLIVTTGGTGAAPRDVTPEATASVIERPVPGISETLRAKSLEKTKTAMLSRGIAGVRGTSLVVNMPGSEKAVRESFEIVLPVLEHAVELIHGRVKDCGRSNA
jgi:molybdopterin adenylyltransferase